MTIKTRSMKITKISPRDILLASLGGIDALFAANQKRFANAMKTEKPGSKKAEQLSAAINAIEGICSNSKKGIKNLVEIITGEKLTDKDELWPLGIVLVPTSNPNSHSYMIGELVVTAKEGRNYGIKADGEQGNHLPKPHTGACRIPTKEELEKISLLQLAALISALQ